MNVDVLDEPPTLGWSVNVRYALAGAGAPTNAVSTLGKCLSIDAVDGAMANLLNSSHAGLGLPVKRWSIILVSVAAGLKMNSTYG